MLKRLIPRFLQTEVKEAVANVTWQSTGPRIQRLEEERARLYGLQTRIEGLETAVEQLSSVLQDEGVPMPPPRHLQLRVVGAYVPAFLESGLAICDDLNALLGVAGKNLASFPRILDWGCGCGRTSRALKIRVPSSEVHGTDIDPEAIAWLRGNYSQFGEFHVAPHRPPMGFPDAHFDFIFGISVFTHLPEGMQFEWLEELRRITKPGGYLIMTTSGESNYSKLPPELRAKVERDGFLYVDGNYGQSINLPAFYQNAFHSQGYIRREWEKYFRIVDIQSARPHIFLDTILLQRHD